jgi:hypothetical protein
METVPTTAAGAIITTSITILVSPMYEVVWNKMSVKYYNEARFGLSMTPSIDHRSLL